MPDIKASYSLTNIHFPQRISLVKKLRIISFGMNDCVMAASFVVVGAWITHIQPLASLFFTTAHIVPFAAFLFLLSGVTLLFGAKRHLLETQQDAAVDTTVWWQIVLPIVFAGVTALVGLVNFLRVVPQPLFFAHLSSFGGLCFFLIGLSLIPPFTRIPHRFHITQLFAFIICVLSLYVVLENVYQLFSPFGVQHIIVVSIPTAFTFTFFSCGLLLRWANRGFFGNFMLDSVGSILALRLMVVNLAAVPMIAFIVLLIMGKTPYNMYQVLSVVVVCLVIFSSVLVWVNVKLLYRYSLEYLLMQESLRSHNINLAAEKEELRKGMARLEQEKQQYLEKLRAQNSWQTIADTLA
jgi:hypothetical protein